MDGRHNSVQSGHEDSALSRAEQRIAERAKQRLVATIKKRGKRIRSQDEKLVAIHLGARIRALREGQGISLQELANRLSVTKPAVCSWEVGRSSPRQVLLPALARALHTSVDYLLAAQESDARLIQNQGSLSTEDVLARARCDIATALGVDPTKVRIEIGD